MTIDQHQHQPHKCPEIHIPLNPIISDTMHRDTLDNVAQIMALLDQLDLSNGLTAGAESGLYWIHRVVIDSVKYVSNNLK